MDSRTRSDNAGVLRASAYDGDSCICRKAGESTEDCPWRCDRATPQQEARFAELVSRARENQQVRSVRS